MHIFTQNEGHMVHLHQKTGYQVKEKLILFCLTPKWSKLGKV